MTVRLWELGTTLLILLVAAIFLIGGQVIAGIVAGALAVFWLLGRSVVSERLGYRYVRRHAQIELARIVALFFVFLATLATLFVAAALGWNHDQEGLLFFAALLGVMVLLRYEIERRIDHYDNLLAGGAAEIAVGTLLDDLEGFQVEHNWLRPDGFGNVDHIVRRRKDGELFAIETKSGWFRAQNGSQAVKNALAVKRRMDAGWVTAVVCVGRASDPVREYRYGRSRIWVVRRDHLAAWLPTASSTRSYHS